MTNRDRFVTFFCPSTPTGPIEPDLTLASPPAGRTFRRRRLGLLTGVLALTLGMGGLLSDGSGSRGTVVAAGDHRDGPSVVISESEGSATLAAVFAETTSTLLAVTTTTMAETTTTTPATSTSTAPTTSTPVAPAARQESTTTAAPTTAAPTTAPPTTAAPTTTAAPRSSPSTTAAPESSGDSNRGDAGYSDPNTLQVWLDLADCESGGNWSINSGNGYYGGLQFSLGTWESVGGSGYPHEHPRDTQIEFGRRLQARDGWGAWPHCSEKLGLR